MNELITALAATVVIVGSGVLLGVLVNANIDGYADSVYADPYPGRRTITRWAYLAGWRAGKRHMNRASGTRGSTK